MSIVGGAGGVGSALAHNLLVSPMGHEVVLIGRRSEAVTCQLMDFAALEPFGNASVVRQGGVDDFSDSDVIVIAASVPFSPEKRRVDFLRDNVEILRPYFREIARLPEDWPGYIVVVTNPVDVLCTWLFDHVRMNSRRILGYSWNDSLRLRVAVADVLKIPPRQVEAWVIGEHGDISIPLFDRVFAGGRRVQLDPDQRNAVLTVVREWYSNWTALGLARTTVWSTAAGVSHMIQGIGQMTYGGQRENSAGWAASVCLRGEYGMRDVSIGFPVSLEDGAPGLAEIPLSGLERDVLQRACTAVRQRTLAIGGL
ncbi:NAD-dependent epimerase/dehydratase family protein [Streptomyces sp. NPDC058686]|uniref:lactate/malate family dehydrogenase n=1 Tax=Streptomyces sp. NPDC058686 TaxID=3346599 RepID=UPI003661E792